MTDTTDSAPSDSTAAGGALSASEQEAGGRLLRIETMLGAGDPQAITAVRQEIEKLKGLLAVEPLRSAETAVNLSASVLTAEGHAARVLGQDRQSLVHYDEALALLDSAPEGERRNRQAANLWSCRGIALLSGGDVSALEDALASFDRAIEILSDSPTPRSAADQWGLASAWLHRADVLAILGGSARITGAIEATRRAREELSSPDPVADPSRGVRLALTWMKESELSARNWLEFRAGDKEQIAAGFHRAAAILRPGAEQGDGEARRVLATVLTNLSRARLFLGESGSPEGQEEALEALRHVGDAEERFVEAAVLATIARLTASLHVANSPQWRDRSIEMTDLIEEGLAVVAKWRKAGMARAFDEGLVAELVLLGAEGYRIGAPQFLGDFLLDQLDPERNEDHFGDLVACHEAADRVLAKGISMMAKGGASDTSEDAAESRSVLLSNWEQCRERLAEVRAGRVH